MPLNEIKTEITKDTKEKVNRIKQNSKKEAEEIIKNAKEQAKEIENKAREEAAKESKKMQIKYNSEIEFEKNKVSMIEYENIIGSELEKIKLIFIKQLKNEINKLLSSGIKQISDTVPESEICIDISKKQNIDAGKLKKYSLKYINGDDIILHDKDYKIKIVISPQKIFNENSDLIRQELAKALFKQKKKH